MTVAPKQIAEVIQAEIGKKQEESKPSNLFSCERSFSGSFTSLQRRECWRDVRETCTSTARLKAQELIAKSC